MFYCHIRNTVQLNSISFESKQPLSSFASFATRTTEERTGYQSPTLCWIFQISVYRCVTTCCCVVSNVSDMAELLRRLQKIQTELMQIITSLQNILLHAELKGCVFNIHCKTVLVNQS